MLAPQFVARNSVRYGHPATPRNGCQQTKCCVKSTTCEVFAVLVLQRMSLAGRVRAMQYTARHLSYAALVSEIRDEHLAELARRQMLGATLCRKCDGRGYVLHEGERHRCRSCEGLGQVLPDGAPLSYADDLGATDGTGPSMGRFGPATDRAAQGCARKEARAGVPHHQRDAGTETG